MVPDSVNYPNWPASHPDIRTSSGGDYNKCRLIEEAVDGKKTGTQTWGTLYPAEYMIKLRPISPGSRTYEIDIGPGAQYYHNTSVAGFYNECNFVVQNGPSFTIQKWLLNRNDYGKDQPQNLIFRVFAHKQSTYVSVLGGGQQIEHEFTYIPLFGGFSLNWQEDGYPQGGLYYWGDHTAVYPNYSTEDTEFTVGASHIYLNRFKYSGAVNYTVDLVNMRITFSQSFYDNYICETGSPYDIFVRCYIVRDGNIHSTSKSSPLNVNYTNKVYYAVPQYDLLEAHGTYNTTYTLSYNGYGGPGSPVIQPSIIKPSGLIEFDRNDYPANGATVVISTYYFHSWLRITNDFTNDLLFRSYVKDAVQQVTVYNYHNNNVGKDGHYTLGGQPTDQQQQAFINYSWVDIKVTNEAKYQGGSDPRMTDLYIDPVPRAGTYRSSLPDNEQIAYGTAGLVNEFKPWDHQEGSRSETDSRCFIRATFNHTKLMSAPNAGGGNTWEKNEMRYMSAEQALRLKKWFLDSINWGRVFKIDAASDDIMAITQTGDVVVLYGAGDVRGVNEIYARIVYSLYDSDQGAITTATAPKAWTLKIKGIYFE